MARGWYVVHTYSGYEQKIEKFIRKMIETDPSFAEICSDVKVPFETLTEQRNGKEREVKHKVLPGYILVEMDLPEDSRWKEVCTKIKKLQGVTGFLTSSRLARPVPLSKSEYTNILQKTGEIKADKTFRPKQNFSVGENVKIIEGPFDGFTGAIEEVNVDKSVLRISVEIFGRSTPVEIEYGQVEKF